MNSYNEESLEKQYNKCKSILNLTKVIKRLDNNEFVFWYNQNILYNIY